MIAKFEPIALEKVWGGNNLKRIYNFRQNNIGEVWGISAHKSFSNKLANGDFAGLTLSFGVLVSLVKKLVIDTILIRGNK